MIRASLRGLASRLVSISQDPARFVLIISLTFGVMSSVLVPQMLASDENAHFLKSYALSSGSLGGKSCAFPRSILYKSNALARNDLTSDFEVGLPSEQAITSECGPASGYVPIMHLPQALGIGMGRLVGGSPSTLVLAGRLANALFYALALYWIVIFVRNRKWVFVVIGLLPTMVHTAGTLSGDVMNNIIVLASLAFAYNLLGQRAGVSRRQLFAIYLTASGLILTKAPNILLILPLLAVPARQFADANSRLAPHRRKWLVLVSSVTIAALLLLIWQKFFGSMLYRDIPTVNPLIAHPLHFITVLFNTYLSPGLGYGDALIRGVVGDFASLTYHLPTILIIVEVLLLMFVLFNRGSNEPAIEHNTQSRAALLSAISLGTFVLAITYALYTAWSILPVRLGPGASYADGVQGRYFTAALILLIPIADYMRRHVSIHTRQESTLGLVVAITSLACLTFYIIETYATFT